MSEQNKQIARRFIDAFAAGDTATLEQIVADQLVDHKPAPGQGPGRAGLVDVVAMYRLAFPDMTISIENQVAEGDFVVVNGIVNGTNTGALMGMPATGKRTSFAYMDMYRIVNGRITDVWHVEDIAGMLQQLGLMPS
jgi:steroid delta-isomerase-like uncharacterized protein